MARKMWRLGKDRQRMANHRFLNALEHGDIVDETVDTLDVGGARRGMTAPGCAEGEAVRTPDVDPDRAVSDLDDRPLQRLRDAGLAHRARVNHDGGAQRSPESIVGKVNGALQELDRAGMIELGLRQDGTERLHPARQLGRVVRIEVGQQGPGKRAIPGRTNRAGVPASLRETTVALLRAGIVCGSHWRPLEYPFQRIE